MPKFPLRKHARRIGRPAVLLGLIVATAGLLLGYPALFVLGCVTLFAGLYFLIFAQVGSF
jgi:hypothetical protein